MGTYDTSYLALDCLPGYRMFGKKCLEVDTLSSSTKCLLKDRANPAKCSQCIPEFFLDSVSGLCMPCSSDCQVCKSATVCTRCSDGYVWSSSGCLSFTIANFPVATMLYDSSLQVAMNAVDVNTSVPIPFSSQLVGSLYIAEGTVSIANESSVLINAVVIMDFNPLVDNILSHFEVIFYVDGSPVQTKSVPYSVTNFADKKLTFQIVMHLVTSPLLNLQIVSRYPIQVLQWKTSVVQYDPAAACHFQLDASTCLICSRYLQLYSKKGVCTNLPAGKVGTNYSLTNFDQQLGNCPTGTKVCTRTTADYALECYSDYYLNNSNCYMCSLACKSCWGKSTNCTSCSSPNVLVTSDQVTNTSACGSCPSNCLTCQDFSLTCSSCSSGFFVHSSGVCAPVCQQSYSLNTNLLCTRCPSECSNCPADDYCSACNVGYVLVDSKCQAFSIELKISGIYDRDSKKIRYEWSPSINLGELAKMDAISLDYDSSLLSINISECFQTYQLKTGICELQVYFPRQSKVQNGQVKLQISKRYVFAGGISLKVQTIPLSNTINYSDESNDPIGSEGTSSYARATSIVLTSFVGLSTVTLSSGASSLLKLTQYIELLVYLNIPLPVNLKAFLVYFSQDIFGLLFNPLDDYSEPGCESLQKFRENNQDCLMLQNDFPEFMLIFIVLVIKFAVQAFRDKFVLMKKANQYLGGFFFCMLLDSVYFDMATAAIINLAMQTTKTHYGRFNYTLSWVVVGLFLPLQTAFIGYYCAIWKDQKQVNVLLDDRPVLVRLGSKILSGRDNQTGADSPPKQEKDGSSVKPVSGFKSWVATINKKITELQLGYYTEEFKHQAWACKQFVLSQQVRAYLSIICLVAFHDQPILQTTLVTTLQVVNTVYCATFQPFKQRIENIRENLTNVLLSVCMASMLAFSNLKQTPNDPQYTVLGYLLIVLISVIFAINIGFVIKNLYLAIRKLVKKPWKFSQKIKPIHNAIQQAPGTKGVEISRVVERSGKERFVRRGSQRLNSILRDGVEVKNQHQQVPCMTKRKWNALSSLASESQNMSTERRPSIRRLTHRPNTLIQRPQV